jgi:hypothetical protein
VYPNLREMKRLSTLLLCAGSFAYPQDPRQPAAAEKFDLKARFTWYAQRTYTDPWRYRLWPWPV